MKTVLASSFLLVSLFVASCGSSQVPPAQLSPSEKNLLSALNDYRASQGKSELKPLTDLTKLARGDAARRVTSGGDYVDLRHETGYERMLTLAGKAGGGETFGSRLMEIWQKNPIQRTWLEGSHMGVGVGTASGATGLQTGVVLLGGFSGEGI